MNEPNISDPEAPALSLTHGRLCVLLAATLWSTSSFFAKILTEPTRFALNEPTISPLQMAFFRVLFAGLVLLPLLQPADIVVRAPMIGMALVFAVMNVVFLSAMALGTAANAILLQYTAPLWMYLASIWLLRERADRRSLVALIFGLAGIGIIVFGGWTSEGLPVILLGLTSGVTFAGVMLFLRVLRSQSSSWLTVWNHLTAAAILAPLGLIEDLSVWPWQMHYPSWLQVGVLFLFGAFQLGLPYFLMTRGLRVVSPQEAGAIALLEPLLNPIWAYFVAPETERVSMPTFFGGALILGGLAWRYWPRKAS